jgi:hypothetical protein
VPNIVVAGLQHPSFHIIPFQYLAGIPANASNAIADYCFQNIKTLQLSSVEAATATSLSSYKRVVNLIALLAGGSSSPPPSYLFSHLCNPLPLVDLSLHTM